MKMLLILFALVLTACRSVPTLDERRQHADALAIPHGWHAVHIQAGQFELTAYLPAKPGKDDTLTIYLEGDGFAWRTSRQPSSDPTPLDPMALRLALAHPQGNAAYLARPCQYTGAGTLPCVEDYWTGKRFSPEVIAATSMALDDLKKTFGARQLYLVGYSGGGAIASLVAARRSDVLLLVTVAGNLDMNYWTHLHHLTPLTHSLNPADAKQQLARVRQVHWSGGKDQIVPTAVAKAFASHWPSTEKPSIWIVKDNDHFRGWVENWPALWEASLQAR